MNDTLRKSLITLCLILVWGGSLAVSSQFTDAGALKAPIMVVGLTGLCLLSLRRLRTSATLVPFIAFWMLAYFRLTRTAGFQEAAVLQVGVFMAFLAGYLRAPLAHRNLLPPVILLCVIRGLMDVVTLSHLGVPAGLVPEGMESNQVVSFFLDKHLFGGALILAAFHHFYLMEKGEPHRPVQVVLYTSSLFVLLSILLVDSRAVQGVFFLCFLPLLFLSVKLDGREPRLERLAWITGITLSLGVVSINLPDMQMHKMASALAHGSPGMLSWIWKASLRAFVKAPWLGSGLGGFRYAIVPLEGAWPALDGESLPTLTHANNHFLERLVELGALGTALEIALFAGAALGFARMYFREYRLEAKYAFFSLSALLLLSLLTPVLEFPPAQLAVWILAGYGWSLLAESRTPRSDAPQAEGEARGGAEPQGNIAVTGKILSPAARGLMGGAMVAVAALHLSLRLPELRADRLFTRAQNLTDINPAAYTDQLVAALRMFPGHEEANYAYAGILTEFHRESEAVKWAEHTQLFAPDAHREAEALTRMYVSMHHVDSAAKYAAVLLRSYPHYLPALEMLMQSYKLQGRCREVDSLRASIAAWGEAYPVPDPQAYTIQSMDSLFRSNAEINFLQRWFGGTALRKKFVERRLTGYNAKSQNHIRLQNLREARCPAQEPDSSHAAKHGPARWRPFLRGWGCSPPVAARASAMG